MILNGNQRGGAKDLALHLMKDENDRVEVHQLRGFLSSDLMGALNEMYAISQGTRCKQFMYSLSLNPPKDGVVSISGFESAVERAEKRLGLEGQPRAIVFHEKEGRRHCHVVWSRIDINTMTARRMSHDREKLTDLSREFFMEYGWKMPKGIEKRGERSPLKVWLIQVSIYWRLITIKKIHLNWQKKMEKVSLYRFCCQMQQNVIQEQVFMYN